MRSSIKLRLIYALAATLMLLAQLVHAQTVTAYKLADGGTLTLTLTPATQPAAVVITAATQPATAPATAPVVAAAPATAPTTQPVILVTTSPVKVRPSKDNTGIPATVKLTDAPAGFKPLAGSTYKAFRFKDQVTIALAKGQVVTFINCLFDAGGDARSLRTDQNQGRVVLLACELRNARDELAYGRGFQIFNSYCHFSGADGFKPQADCLIQGNYVTDLGHNDGAHADGVQLLGNARIRVIGNFFDQVNDKSCNRNLMASVVGLADIEWVGNWHTGRGWYALQLYDSIVPGSIVIKDNIFERYAGDLKMYTPLHVMAGVVRSGNKFSDGRSAD